MIFAGNYRISLFIRACRNRRPNEHTLVISMKLVIFSARRFQRCTPRKFDGPSLASRAAGGLIPNLQGASASAPFKTDLFINRAIGISRSVDVRGRCVPGTIEFNENYLDFEWNCCVPRASSPN